MTTTTTKTTSLEHVDEEETTVNGKVYTYWSNFIARATYACNMETGEVCKINDCGYISRDLTVRKAIARAFHEPTFRKNAVKA